MATSKTANAGSPNTVVGAFQYTSPYSATGIATVGSSVATLNANLNSNGSLVAVIHAKVATTVTYSTTLTQNGSNSGAYELDLSAIQIS